MQVSRRTFLKYCSLSAAAIGLDPLNLGLLEDALADDATAPSVIWLQGSACVGCSISLLNHITDVAGMPTTVTDLLVDHINLIYHPTLMALAGESAAAALREVYEAGNYILVVEGGVPTAFNGNACIAYNLNGARVPFTQAVSECASRAAHIVCVGTCAAWGGIPAAGSNPTGVVGVSEFIGRPTINISGCPANPHWVVQALAMLLIGQIPELDADGRPVPLYEAHGFIHDTCPRNLGNPSNEANQFGQDGKCLIRLGCRGPFVKANCRDNWNGIEGEGHWCIGVNAPCHGCVERNFPGPESFYEPYTPSS